MANKTSTNNPYLTSSLNKQQALAKQAVLTQGKQWTITPEKIEFLFKKPLSASQRISLYGFQGPRDLAEFLKTPAGKIYEKELRALIIEGVEQVRAETQRQLDRQIRLERLLGAIHLAKLIRKAAKANFLKADTERQIQSILNKQKALKKEPEKESQAGKPVIYSMPTIDNVNDINELNKQILEYNLEQSLEQLSDLELDIDAFDYLERQLILDSHFNKAYANMERLDNLDNALKLGEIDKILAELHLKIGAQEAGIIAQLTPSSSIEDNKSPKLEGLQARKQIFEEMRAHLMGQKLFYDAEGNLTHSHKNAQFIVENGTKLVKHNGQLHLIPSNKDFESLSQAEIEIAQKRFEKAKPNITNIHKAFKQNTLIDIDVHHKKAEQLALRCGKELKALLELNNQLRAVEGIIATVNADFHSQSNTTPVPRPSPAHSAKSGKTTELSIRVAEKALKLLRMNPSEEMVRAFSDSFSFVNGKVDPSLKNLFSQMLQPGQRPTYLQMQTLLKNLALIGVTAYNTRATATPEPARVRKDPEPQGYTSPSPFSTKPRPY